MATVTVDWGDSDPTESFDVDVADDGSWTLPSQTHTYDEPGIHTVTVTGPSGEVCTDIVITANLVQILLPCPITVATGQPTVYTTRLRNYGSAIGEVTETIRFCSTDGPLTVDDITYETMDTGIPVEADLIVDGDCLLFTEQFPIPARLNATSQVRITVHRDLTNLTSTSTITDNADDTVLDTVECTFNVGPPVTPPNPTAADPLVGRCVL